MSASDRLPTSDRADTAARDRSRPLRELVNNPIRAQLRPALLARLGAADQRLEPRDLSLLSIESSTYASLHLKRSPGVSCCGFATSRTPGFSDGFPIAIRRDALFALD